MYKLISLAALSMYNEILFCGKPVDIKTFKASQYYILHIIKSIYTLIGHADMNYVWIKHYK